MKRRSRIGGRLGTPAGNGARMLLQLGVAAAGLTFVGWVLYRSQPPPPLPPPTARNSRPELVRARPRPELEAPGPRTPPAGALPQPGSVLRPSPAPTEAGAFAVAGYPRAVTNVLEAQVALARRGFSSGPIDGVLGSQTRAALRAFQQREQLPVTGALDAATRARLRLESPALTVRWVTARDLERLLPLSPTWWGKSQQPRLDYTHLLELVAEEHRAHPTLVRQLNPGVDWERVQPGQAVTVPHVPEPELAAPLAFLRIRLSERALTGYDVRTNLLVHFPCSIAARVEKRPLGRLTVVTGAWEPNYTFQPALFPESAEARRLNRPLTLPPGPNNPVGLAWIGLDRPGYGIHGTPRPEEVGRTESHGCFRLANWDAVWLLKRVWPGMPVDVEP